MSGDELIQMTATEVAARLAAGDVSPVELVDAAAARIEAVNPAVNALPILCLDEARDRAVDMTDHPVSYTHLTLPTSDLV